MKLPNLLSAKLKLALIFGTTSCATFASCASNISCPQAQAAELAVLSGAAAQTQSKMVCSRINWLTSLDEAKQTAKKEHKLIVWIHMLGNIDGFT